MPYGFELEMFEGKRVAIEVLQYTRYQNEMIAKAGLAHFMQLGTGDTGSFALAKDQSDFFLMSLNANSNYICNTVNSYAIPQLVDLNWDVDGYPKLKCEKVGGRNADGIIKGTNELVNGRIVLPDDSLEEFMQDLLGLPERDEATTGVVLLRCHYSSEAMKLRRLIKHLRNPKKPANQENYLKLFGAGT